MITAKLVGSEKLVRRVEFMPQRLHDELKRYIKAFTLQLTAKVKADKLSGQVLNVRTGRLRRSIHPEVIESPGRITGIVGTNVVYAGRHEFGGTVQVKEHLRTIKQAWGRPLKEPKTITVKAHNVNVKERSFLRSSLKEMEDQFYQGVDSAVRRALG